ncbi:protein HGH1 homolog isoform X2 [Varroa jacobsoni]|uniref:Protein HGH1 homolog n=1 Tax=Varroa destructor TaxID=109461 RepID=A0A7M7JER2_VARDE|nr:protein HGH1 homolog isoform X2 [Varroa destructor]XP_022702341.1 protein HGH1 homolog isoform X2 [Varroa jacobsoni]
MKIQRAITLAIVEDSNKMSGSDQLEELIKFLHPEAPALSKGPAVIYLLGMTATEDGLAVFRRKPALIDTLCILIEKDSSSTIIGKAYECILNLSSYEDMALHILTRCKNFVKNNVVSDALNINEPNAMRACAVLANLTQTKNSAEKTWTLIKPLADNLLFAFCHRTANNRGYSPARVPTAAEVKNDAMQDHIAFVFSNLTALHSVRKWFMDPEARRLEKLFPFISLSTATPTRRFGAVGTIRNCTFDTEYHQWLLKELDILPRLLIPLIGPEVETNLDEEDMEQLPIDCQYLGPDKKMEENPEIRKMLIEALNQLCATSLGRKYLKENGTYFVLRELHKVEKDRVVVVACENLVDILIQDEPEQDNLKEIDIPAELVQKFEKMDAQALKDGTD